MEEIRAEAHSWSAAIHFERSSKNVFEVLETWHPRFQDSVVAFVDDPTPLLNDRPEREATDGHECVRAQKLIDNDQISMLQMILMTSPSPTAMSRYGWKLALSRPSSGVR